MCVHCGHVLAAKDLIPVFSWIQLRGKCRYCQKPISRQYPFIESLTAFLFVFSYLFWPSNLDSFLPWAVFTTWLAILILLISLIVYDFKWMLLPNKIISPLGVLAGVYVLLKLLDQKTIIPLDLAGSVFVGGGIFYILFQVSKGKWIGGGDVKLGFVLGLIIMNPLQAGLMLFLASVMGFIATLPLMLTGRLTPKTRIPFGPFLIVATIIVVLFGAEIIDWYQRTFLIV